MNQSTVNTASSGGISGVHRDILDSFVADLRAACLSESRIHRLRLDALHFLIWLEYCDCAIESIDNAVLCTFRRHDCHCPGMERERKKMLASDTRSFMTGVLKLVCFLEDQGHIPHTGDLATNLCHLDWFIMRCQEQGYRSWTLRRFQNSCKHVLVWLYRSRISIRDVDAATLQEFLNHNCVSVHISRAYAGANPATVMSIHSGASCSHLRRRAYCLFVMSCPKQQSIL